MEVTELDLGQTPNFSRDEPNIESLLRLMKSSSFGLGLTDNTACNCTKANTEAMAARSSYDNKIYIIIVT